MAALFLAMPGNAFANMPLTASLVLVLPAWLAFRTFLLSLVAVIVIETAVLVVRFRVPRRCALRTVCVANAFSALVGAAVVFDPLHALVAVGLVVATPFWIHRRLRWPWYANLGASLAALGGFFIFMMSLGGSVPSLIAVFYALMAFAFLATIVLEAGSFARRLPQVDPLKASVWVNGASYAALCLLLLVGGFRSGGLAITETPLVFAAYGSSYPPRDPHRPGDFRPRIDRIEEILMWEESVGRGRWLMGSLRQPTLELWVVKQWAEDGHLEDAKELYAMLTAHRAPTDATAQLWSEAATAVGAGGSAGTSSP
ncbi:MAG: hypothetical protein U0166_01315 [Acidobacteriota bacterium]